MSLFRDNFKKSFLQDRPDWVVSLLPPVDIEQISIDGKRFYEVPGGNRYPSVTTVLSSLTKEGIKEWEEKVGKEEADRIRKKATTHGTAVHALAESYLKNENVDITSVAPTVYSAFRNIVPFLKDIDTIYGIETPLYSHRLKTAGRTDLICSFKSLGTILDFKTSRKEKKEEWIENYFIQATAYSLMAYEMYDIKLKQIAIVIAVEDSPPQLFVKLVDQFIPKTLALFNTYHANNG